MTRTGLMIKTLLLLISINPVFCNQTAGTSCTTATDTIRESQILYSGRLWRNLYSHVVGDQFFVEPEFVQSTVYIGGRTYAGIPLKYDIFRDELIGRTSRGIFIQLNKEHIDSFSLNLSGKIYRFINKGDTSEADGYLRVLYDGKNKFFVKYQKKIDLLAVDAKYDTFYQIRKMYLFKDGKYHTFNGRMELYKLFDDHKKDVKAYIRKNRIRITKEEPESFVPLIEYYDRIRQ